MGVAQEQPLDKMSDQQRQELIQLGYPDDGYDYLKHLRAAGRGGTAQLTGTCRVLCTKMAQNPMTAMFICVRPAGRPLKHLQAQARAVGSLAQASARYKAERHAQVVRAFA